MQHHSLFRNLPPLVVTWYTQAETLKQFHFTGWCSCSLIVIFICDAVLLDHFFDKGQSISFNVSLGAIKLMNGKLMYNSHLIIFQAQTHSERNVMDDGSALS